jgi:hypothetical protein
MFPHEFTRIFSTFMYFLVEIITKQGMEFLGFELFQSDMIKLAMNFSLTSYQQ